MINNYIFLRKSNFYFAYHYQSLNEHKPWERFILLPHWKFMTPKQVIGEIKI